MTRFALLFLVACAPTQVVVFVDTPLGVPCELDEIAIDTNGDAQADRTGNVGDGPISVTLVDTGGGDYATIGITGMKAGQPVLAGTATVRFSAGDDQTLAVMLGPDCTIDQPCKFAATTQHAGIAAPVPVARTFCSAGYALSSRTTTISDPLVKDACAIGTQPRASLTFGPVCQVSAKPCTTDADCAGESPASCAAGEARVPDNVVAALVARDFAFAGAPIPGIWVGEGGYLAFTTERPNRTRPAIGLSATLDKITTPAPGVMAFWDDLAAKSEACAALDGAGTLWITWNACFVSTGCNGGDNLVFSVGLEPTTNIVRIGYLAMDSSDAFAAEGIHAVAGVREHLRASCTPDHCDAATATCTDTHQPCGYTQAFAKTQQSSPWPMTSFVFTPKDEP